MLLGLNTIGNSHVGEHILSGITYGASNVIE